MESTNRLVESIAALQLTRHGQRIGILTHYIGGKNILTFDPEYKALREQSQPIMTLTQKMNPNYLDRVLVSSQRVPAVLSNLLPEGALRELLSRALKIHPTFEELVPDLSRCRQPETGPGVRHRVDAAVRPRRNRPRVEPWQTEKMVFHEFAGFSDLE